MDPITHTVLAMLTIFISYMIGHYVGKHKGVVLGVAHMIHFFEQKVGVAQMRIWEKELEVVRDE